MRRGTGAGEQPSPNGCISNILLVPEKLCWGLGGGLLDVRALINLHPCTVHADAVTCKLTGKDTAQLYGQAISLRCTFSEGILPAS